MSKDAKKVFCSFCFNGKTGDNPTKYRAYLYGFNLHPQGVAFKCFNCGEKCHAKVYYESIGEQWESIHINDIFSIDNNALSKKSEIVINHKIEDLIYFDIKQSSTFKLQSNPINFLLQEWLEKRMIPKHKWKHFSYSNNFMQMYYDLSDNDKDFDYKDKRAIIEFRHNDKLYGLKARALRQSDIKYLTFHNENEMFFNEYCINVNEPVYILEGEIDSMFISNSVGIGSVHKAMAFLSRKVELKKKNVRFLFDNDLEGYLASIKFLEMGYMVFSWKSFLSSYNGLIKIKDINDCILNGISLNNIDDHFINSRLKMFMIK